MAGTEKSTIKYCFGAELGGCVKVEVDVLGSPSLIVRTVSVDVSKAALKNRAQELCENRGGRPGLPSLISLRFLWT